ncbi:hypothetical protein ACFXJ8_43795 [Nonomuraea sp. NPDC059194]|uniref:hypothetical protein n=1 Tax=Nonomuraea sp. NPDC059194 TaxID=3346764 RepID=UPI00369EA9C2
MTNPYRPGARPWLELRSDETKPRVLEAVEPVLVVWSSLWPTRPDDLIRFDLRTIDDGGCALRWTLLTAAEQPDEQTVGRLRYRLNYLVNAQLRFSFGQ